MLNTDHGTSTGYILFGVCSGRESDDTIDVDRGLDMCLSMLLGNDHRDAGINPDFSSPITTDVFNYAILAII